MLVGQPFSKAPNPSDWVMCRYMADLIIGYFQNVALHVVDHAPDSGRGELQHEGPVMEALPEPMFVGNSEAHASHCRMDEDFRALVSSDQVRKPPCYTRSPVGE